MANIRVVGGYKCGCSYGPVWQKDRLEYCGVHGDEIANEYDVSFMSAPNKVLQPDGGEVLPVHKHLYIDGRCACGASINRRR